MALFNIPAPRSGVQAFNEGFNSQENMMARLIQNKLEHLQREQAHEHFLRRQAQEQEHFLKNFGLNQARENRLAELHPYELAQMRLNQQLAQQTAPLELEHLRAKIEHEQARAEQAKMANMYGNPNELEAGAQEQYGPTRGMPLAAMPKGVQNQVHKEQIEMQSKVNAARHGLHTLNEMEKIIKKNPDLSRDFVYILGNPEDKSFVRSLTRKYLDKNKLAEIEKFTKYSNDFVLEEGSRLGKNFTDAKLKAYQLAKMHGGNTDKANLAIINNYRNKLQPLVNYGPYLKKAFGKYELPYFEDDYTNEALGIGNRESSKPISHEKAAEITKNYESKTSERILRINPKTGKYEYASK